MANGLPLVDAKQASASHEFKAPANNFTSFSGDMLRDAQATISRPPESGAVTITEPLKYEDPTISMSPQDKELTDRLMAQIMDKPETKKPQEAISQIENKIPQEIKKSQGFFASIWESIKNFFKDLFR